jgi:hypothetical protein
LLPSDHQITRFFRFPMTAMSAITRDLGGFFFSGKRFC